MTSEFHLDRMTFPFTKEEERRLIELATTEVTATQIAQEMKRTPTAIRSKYKRMGIKRNHMRARGAVSRKDFHKVPINQRREIVRSGLPTTKLMERYGLSQSTVNRYKRECRDLAFDAAIKSRDALATPTSTTGEVDDVV